MTTTKRDVLMLNYTFFEVLILPNVANDVINEKTLFAWPDFCRFLVCNLVAKYIRNPLKNFLLQFLGVKP